MQRTIVSQAKQKTTWCLLVAGLVFIFVAMGVLLFLTPGHSTLLRDGGTPPGLFKSHR